MVMADMSYSKQLEELFGKRFALLNAQEAHLLGISFNALANGRGERNEGKAIGILLCLYMQGKFYDGGYDELSSLAKSIGAAKTKAHGQMLLEAWMEKEDVE